MNTYGIVYNSDTRAFEIWKNAGHLAVSFSRYNEAAAYLGFARVEETKMKTIKRNTIKTLIGGLLLLGSTLLLTTPADAMRKCPQADGSIISVPESATCEFKPPETPESRLDTMMDACVLLFGAQRHNTPLIELEAKIRKLTVVPTWGQCDELQRSLVRSMVR